MRYALELYTCDKCGHYPIEMLKEMPADDPLFGRGERASKPYPRHPKCPKCGSFATHFEKVYEANSEGRIIE